MREAPDSDILRHGEVRLKIRGNEVNVVHTQKKLLNKPTLIIESISKLLFSIHQDIISQ